MTTKEYIQNKIETKISITDIKYISQKDFDTETSSYRCPYIISHPGHYKLVENIKISYFPTRWDSFEPNVVDKFGTPAGFVIACAYVIFDLNGFAIYQSVQDFCMQRFFAIIQLNNMPFNIGVGPIAGETRNKLYTAEYCIIKNGTIGLSSHQSILGNNNKYIILEDLNCKDFEVTAINLNNIDTLYIENSIIGQSIGVKRLLPFSPHFSGLIFCDRLLVQIYNHQGITINEKKLIKKSINSIREDIIPFIKDIYKFNSLTDIYKAIKYRVGCNKGLEYLFNESGKTPCNMHGIKITGPNPSVGPFHTSINDFSKSTDIIKKGSHSKNIYIKNVKIENLHANINEELVFTKGRSVVHISAGLKASYSITHIPCIIELIDVINSISKTNPTISKLIKSNIDDDIINLIVNRKNCGKCTLTRGLDPFGHINKGVHAIRIGSSDNVIMSDVIIKNIYNTGKPLSNDYIDSIMTKYGLSSIQDSDTTLLGSIKNVGLYSIGAIISGSTNVTFERFDISQINSPNGNTIGLCVNNISNNVNIKQHIIHKLTSCPKCYDPFLITVDSKSKNVNLDGVQLNPLQNSSC